MSRLTRARLTEHATAAGHVTIELRCACGRTSMTMAGDRPATIAELLRRHRQASPTCRHLDVMEVRP